MMTTIFRVLASWRRRPRTRASSVKVPADLVDHFAVECTAYCPCGSQTLHWLTLVSTSECARCGRTIGIRGIQYFRPGPGALPVPVVEIGYLLTDAALAKRPTQGVH